MPRRKHRNHGRITGTTHVSGEDLRRRIVPVVLLVALLIVAVFLGGRAEAGPWAFDRNAGRVETYLQYWENENTFNDASKSRRNPNDGRYSEWLTEFKLEYGLFDQFNLLLSVPHKSARYADTNDTWTEDGFGDMRFALKWQLPSSEEDAGPLTRWFRHLTDCAPACGCCCCQAKRDRSGDCGGEGQAWVFAVQVGTKIPLGYDDAAVPPLGNGHTDIEALFLLGTSFKVWDDYGYFSAEFGYRVRNGPHTDAIPFRLEGAVPLPFVKGLSVKASFDGIEGIQPTDRLDEDYANGVIGLLWEAERVGAISRQGKGWFLEAGYGNTLTGRNTGDGDFGFLKLALQF